MKFNEKWMLFLMATFVSFFGIVDTLLKKTEATEIIVYEEIDSNINFDSSLIIDYRNNYILYLELGTTVRTLLSKIDVSEYNVTVLDNGNKKKDNNLTVLTGDKLVFTLDDEVVKEYSLSVMGDSNGDGISDVSDLLQMKKYIVGWINPVTGKELDIDNVYYYSLDLDMNGVVDIIDLGTMNKVMKGIDINAKN